MTQLSCYVSSATTATTARDLAPMTSRLVCLDGELPVSKVERLMPSQQSIQGGSFLQQFLVVDQRDLELSSASLKVPVPDLVLSRHLKMSCHSCPVLR
uniref:Uncharacterized protein n=1 Tax=Oryza nivara TaxID=4536 RepID=A0A0E0HJI2_ORYNI